MPDLVYVIHEYPPVTQTFVWREIETIRRSGRNVRVFVLRPSDRTNLGSAGAFSVRSVGLLVWARHLPSLIHRLIDRRREVGELFALPPASVHAKIRQLWALLNALALTTLLEEEQADDVHLHAHFFGRTLDVLTYTRALANFRVRASATGHAADATHPESRERLHSQVARLDLVICTSDFVRRSLQEIVGDIRPTCVVRTGVHPQPDNRNLLGKTLVRIGSVGRLVEKKGFADALLAAELLRDAGVPFRWTFVGDGPLRGQLRRASKQLVADGHVLWLGYLDNHRVHAWLGSDVDVLVQPCRHAANGDIDGVPVVLIEAMSMGIPVVTTRISGIPELVTDGVTGDVCEPRDYVELARRLGQIGRDRGAARARGLAGRAHVNSAFNDEREVHKLLAHIDACWIAQEIAA